jgi:hypothetical protein
MLENVEHFVIENLKLFLERAFMEIALHSPED